MTRHGAVVIALGVMLVLVGAASAVGVAHTIDIRYERDVSRMVFNDNLQLLAEMRRRAGQESDSLGKILAASPAPKPAESYIVVSIEDRQLWYRRGDSVLFTAPVATGSGRILERSGNDVHWRFETPRGRLTVIAKDTNPLWVPPDWHYVELAQNRGLGVVRLNRGDELAAGDGAVLRVSGSNVVRRSADGTERPIEASDGREIVVGGNVVIPPFGTNQRKYAGVLGTHRLSLGDGYAIHGTNRPETIGRSVSHGCIRLRNEDIRELYSMVPVGTPVFIY